MALERSCPSATVLLSGQMWVLCGYMSIKCNGSSNGILSAKSSCTILCISDEPVFLRSMAQALTTRGYAIQCYYDPHAALCFMRENAVEIVICDYRLRSFDGVAVLCQVKEHWPETVRILYGSAADLEFIENDFSQAGLYRFLEKPFNMPELMLTLDHGFAFHDLILENRRLTRKIQEMASTKSLD